MRKSSLEELQNEIRKFAQERDWEQFHSPKNLAMGLNVEAGEVLEHFLWLDENKSENLPLEELAAVRLECADVLIYLVRLGDKLGFDLLAAAREKLEINAKKYPIEKAKGSAVKYDKL